LQEGVSAEASSYAGHNKLDNLILIYDSNDVTLDAMANASQSEDAGKRYEAYGWHVQTVDGHDMAAVAAALQTARATKGKPHLIIAKTLIGKGIPEVAGTSKAHGEGGQRLGRAAQKVGDAYLGIASYSSMVRLMMASASTFSSAYSSALSTSPVSASASIRRS
jgi:transketolase